ncbi:hypothetical protein D3C71_1736650 [compost metagenome]
MIKIFLESKAAAQISAYGAAHGWDDKQVSETIFNAYSHSCEQDDDFPHRVVSKDLKGELNHLDIDVIMSWADTPEGSDFWANICQVRV